MKSTLKMREALSRKIGEQEALRKLLKKEKRSFRKKERQTFDTLELEISQLMRKIKDSEALDIAKKRSAEFESGKKAKGQKLSPEQNVRKSYSLIRAIAATVNGAKLDGLELEMHQEAVKEASNTGRGIQGLGVPEILMNVNPSQDRALSVATPTAAGYMVGQESIATFEAALTPRTNLQKMGAVFMGGLVGDLPIPIGDARGTSAWRDEGGTVAESTPTVKRLLLTPKELSSFTAISKKLLIQTSDAAEKMVRDDISNGIAISVEEAAYIGSGTSGQPLGIFNHNDVNFIVIGANGGAGTRALMVAMKTGVTVANADVDGMGFIVTPELQGFFQNLQTGTDTGIFVWPADVKDMFLSYPAVVSNLLPKNLTRGTGTNLHGAIFGDFKNLIVANWGGADLIVDPYTRSGSGEVKITANTLWDIGIKHGQAFSAIKDFVVS